MLFAILLIISCLSSFAQQKDALDVDITKLDDNELRVYRSIKEKMTQAKSVEVTPEKIEKYADIGKAFGSAFKECWGTVSSDAEKFAQSPAGKLAMFLVSWKIMANDVQGLVKSTVRVLVGFLVWLVITPFYILTVYRNCVRKKMGKITSCEKLGFFRRKVTYGSVEDPPHEDWLAAYGACYLVFFLAVWLVMFV